MYQAILRNLQHQNGLQPFLGKNGVLWIFALSIIAVFFRFHVFAFLELKELSRITLILPLAVIVVISIGRHERFFANEKLLWTAFAAILLAFFVVGMMALQEISWDEARSVFIHKVVALVFLSLVLASSLKVSSLYFVLRYICLFIVFCGGLLSIGESIAYKFFALSSQQVAEFLTPVSGHVGGTSADSFIFDHNRVMGFGMGPHETAFSILAAWVFLMESKSLPRWIMWVGSTIAIWSIIQSAGFTPIAVMLAYGLYYLIRQFEPDMKARSKAKLGAIVALVLLLLIIGVVKSPLIKRFNFYAKNWSFYSQVLEPTFAECNSVKILGKSPTGTDCVVPEVKFIAPSIHFGFASHLPYYILVLLPLFQMFRWKQMGPVERSMFMCYLILIASLLHYPAIEKWGQNYFFFTLVAALMQCNDQELKVPS